MINNVMFKNIITDKKLRGRKKEKVVRTRKWFNNDLGLNVGYTLTGGYMTENEDIETYLREENALLTEAEIKFTEIIDNMIYYIDQYSLSALETYVYDILEATCEVNAYALENGFDLRLVDVDVLPDGHIVGNVKRKI